MENMLEKRRLHLWPRKLHMTSPENDRAGETAFFTGAKHRLWAQHLKRHYEICKLKAPLEAFSESSVKKGQKT